MADNVNIPSSGSVLCATDSIGGVQYPRVKVTYGDDGSSTDASTTNPLPSRGLRWNGSGWDDPQGTIETIGLASAARTATPAAVTFTSATARGLWLMLNVTAASGTGGLTPNVQSLDPASANWTNWAVWPAAITATGLYRWMIYPGITASTASTYVASSFGALPRTNRLFIGVGDASSYTYSLGYVLLP